MSAPIRTGLKPKTHISSLLMISILIFFRGVFSAESNGASGAYGDLVTLFHDLRQLECPTGKDGVPDYSRTSLNNIRHRMLDVEERFIRIDTSGWTIEQKVDRELVRAEMNGLDFNLRVLQPWQRDPAYYVLLWSEQSDTPSHEGPVCHAAIEIWEYSFPLSAEDEKKLTAQLKVIPPFLDQARTNLTGNARDLWNEGIRNVSIQASDLDELEKKTESAGKEFHTSLSNAKNATIKFGEWLKQQLPLKTGPSGIGKENYTWYLRHVLLEPMTWDDEVTLLKRELARAYASLEQERQHNKALPPMRMISSPKEYDSLADHAVTHLMTFLKEQKVLPVRDYMEPALRKHLGSFEPEGKRSFFTIIMHSDPLILYTHATHWFDLARMKEEPHQSIIRREAQPFNIWDSRSEGLATGMEELLMRCGLYDDNPRSKELVWVMLAQRCARGLASLYVQSNEFTLDQGRKYHVQWTPSPWNTGDPSLVIFEQQLYLRQPGYGTGYITGKYLVDRLIMDRSRQIGKDFRMFNFFDEMYTTGMIPVTLIRWQLTRNADEIRDINYSK